MDKSGAPTTSLVCYGLSENRCEQVDFFIKAILSHEVFSKFFCKLHNPYPYDHDHVHALVDKNERIAVDKNKHETSCLILVSHKIECDVSIP